MELGIAEIVAAVFAGLVALDKANYHLRKRNGSAAVTQKQLTSTLTTALAPIIDSVNRVEDKADKHSERLAVVEATIKAHTNGGGM